MGRDLDSTKHTHRLTKPDMDVIKQMTLDQFEIYDLEKDIGQQKHISVESFSQGPEFVDQIRSRLKQIQSEGPFWDSLPPASQIKRYKYEWRHLRPTGFSN